MEYLGYAPEGTFFWRWDGWRDDFADGFPAGGGIAPILRGEDEPDLVCMDEFANFVTAGNNDPVVAPVRDGVRWKKDQFVGDLDGADRAGRFGHRRGRKRQRGQELGDVQVLIGGVDERQGFEQGAGGFVGSSEMMEEIRLEKKGFVTWPMRLEEGFQFAERLEIAFSVN